MSQPRPTPALLSPFTTIGRELGDLMRNPVAVIGGLLGSTAFIGLAAALALLGPSISDAHPGEPDELVVEFMPGALVRLGDVVDPTEKIVVQATRAADDTAVPTVTDDDRALPDPDPARNDDPKPDVKPREKPNPNKPDAPISDRDRDSNTPYNDPATVRDPAGDPFGSPDGWADMAKDGDPWATGVLAALNGMTVGSYAGLGQDSTYKFQLVICADGRVDDVRTKQSTGKPDFDGLIRNAIEALKLPRAPADIARQLAGGCKKIPYLFTWRGKSSRGSVE